MADPEKAVKVPVDNIGVSAGPEVMDSTDIETGVPNTQTLDTSPLIPAALKRKLTIDGTVISHMASLPKTVKRRIKALKKLQLDCINLEAKFFQEMHSVECKYQKLYAPYFEKRNLLVSGTVEATDEDCDFPSDTEKDFDMCSEIAKVKLEEEQNKDNELKMFSEDVKGIPEFWLTAFKNVDMMAEMIQEYDEPILKHLIDVKVILSDVDSKQPGFTLEFHFEPNEYFTNTVLTKHYEMKFSPDMSEPFAFEGPEIEKCKGCTIEWKKGKNVTVKTIKKKQKHKARGAVRTVTKTVQNESFFNFFNPPSVPDDEEQMDEETQSTLALDFDVGNFLKDRLIPRAVLYYTGEAISDDEYDEEEEDEEEEEFDLDEEEEDDDEAEQVTNVKPVSHS